jgi:hypothetical protein
VYGSKLEIASPRFSQRADFFTYICFACFVILVSQTRVIIFLLPPWEEAQTPLDFILKVTWII